MPEVSSRVYLCLALLVGLVGSAVSLGGTFVLDDPIAVEQSVCVTGAFDPGRIFGTNFWCEQGALRSIQSWRPLPVLVWWVLFHVGGGSALPFHLFNVALHSACIALVYACGTRLGLARASAGLGAIVFAALAVHVDAVATVVGAADLLAAAFTLLAVWAFAAGRGVFVLWCGLALLSKESGVLSLALVVALAVLGKGRSGERGVRWVVGGVIAAALLMVALLIVRGMVLGAFLGSQIPAFVNPLVDASWSARLVTGVALVGRAHRVMLVADPLSADYAHAALGVGSEVDLVDGILGLAALLGWSLLAWRAQSPALRMLAIWVLGTLAFFSNVPFVLPAIFAERLCYVPSVAVALTLGHACARAPEALSLRAWIVRGGLGLFVVAQTAVSAAHAWRYGDELRIIEASVEATPRNARTRMWLAQRRLAAGDLEEARTHARAAQSVRPRWGLPPALIAASDDLEGQPERALRGFLSAMELDAGDPEVANLFIQFLLRHGMRERAVLVYRGHAKARGGVAHPEVVAP